jgi:hypothetical protein
MAADRSNEPLSVMDKLVFGHTATRRPDGSIREGGSGHDPHVVAHRAKLDERAAASVAPDDRRTLDPREVHPLHGTPQ